LLLAQATNAQNFRTQYPVGLKNAYFSLNIGHISYPFSESHLEPGFSSSTVIIPNTGVRLTLYGYPVTKHISAKITYMRPVNWVQYHNVNGSQKNHSVWKNIAGLTLEGRLPLNNKISISGEAGLGVITRNGFEVNGIPAIKDVSYGTGLFGASAQYHINKKWDLQLSTAWSPECKKNLQPRTLFIGAGFSYHLRPLPNEKVIRNAATMHFFPKEILFAGITSNAAGYGVNNFLSEGAFPVFWGGDAHVRNGFSLSYQRNIFHARKVFAMDWGVHTGLWSSRDKQERFFTFSLGPVFRFHFLHTNPADFFFEYSVAGPSYISKTKLDDVRIGRRFTFHDFMGIGVFAGKNKKVHAGLRIAHYSNGNLFPQNDGVKVPLTFNLGYVLK
jgi:hypothetical protein